MIKKILLVLGLVIVLSITGFYLYIRPKYVVPILMYHHIDDPPAGASAIRRDLSVSPQRFRRQLEYLRDQGYEAITLNDEGKAEVTESYCFGCGICARFCPEEAISLKEGLRKVFIPPPRLRQAV